jgi:hypothetical protein
MAIRWVKNRFHHGDIKKPTHEVPATPRFIPVIHFTAQMNPNDILFKNTNYSAGPWAKGPNDTRKSVYEDISNLTDIWQRSKGKIHVCFIVSCPATWTTLGIPCLAGYSKYSLPCTIACVVVEYGYSTDVCVTLKDMESNIQWRDTCAKYRNI